MTSNLYLDPPVALTIAGSDSGGGAGIQADLKTFAALGVYGCSVISSLTAQNTLGVQGVFPVPAEFVGAQLSAVVSDFKINAIKTGMLANAAIIEVIANHLPLNLAVPLVVDPVMVATSGDRLLEEEAVAALIKHLLPRASLVTPNLLEAAALLGETPAQTFAQVQHQAERILALGPRAVLIKGGHGTGAEAVDLLLDASGFESFVAPRLATKNTHGTGCTLASAIAAGLAKGLPLREALANAKAYLHAALTAGQFWHLGRGNGPVHHFYPFY